MWISCWLRIRCIDWKSGWIWPAIGGKTDLEKDAYEANAKRLITTWGGFQEDYAARFWSGLIKDYYIPRMKLYFSEQRADLDRWEENWIKAPWHNTSTSFEDPLQSAIKLVERYKGE